MAEAQNTNVQEQDINQLLKVRREKLAALQEAGKDPFQITKYDVTHHSTDIKENFDTLEGQIVRLSDKIAYVNHDIDDAIRGGILSEADIPPKFRKILGNSTKERLNTITHDVIIHSMDAPEVRMSEEVAEAMKGLRKFMFENVYRSKKVKQDEELDKIRNMLFFLYDYFLKNPEKLPKERLDMVDEWGLEEVVKDQIAGMTDRYAVNMFSEIFIPKGWR